MTIRPGISLLIIGSAAYVIALVAFIPASWLAWGLSRTNAPFVLTRVQGSLWNGQGQFYLKEVRGNSFVSPTIYWQLSPVKLIIGKLGFKAKGRNSEVGLLIEGSTSPGSINFSKVHLSIPIRLLAAVYAPLTYAGLNGRATISSDELYIGRNIVSGGADVKVDALSSSLIETKPLGSYLIKARSENNIVKARVSTTEGVLGASGDVVWKPLHGGTVQIDATVNTEGLDSATTSMVRRLGVADNNGNVRWRWNGTFRP